MFSIISFICCVVSLYLTKLKIMGIKFPNSSHIIILVILIKHIISKLIMGMFSIIYSDYCLVLLLLKNNNN
jgi:hypothetical protein